jgi:hypothetical protein
MTGFVGGLCQKSFSGVRGLGAWALESFVVVFFDEEVRGKGVLGLGEMCGERAEKRAKKVLTRKTRLWQFASS